MKLNKKFDGLKIDDLIEEGLVASFKTERTFEGNRIVAEITWVSSAEINSATQTTRTMSDAIRWAFWKGLELMGKDISNAIERDLEEKETKIEGGILQ